MKENPRTNKWRTVALADVARIERSSLQPEEIESGTTYVGLEHIETGGAFLDPKPVETGSLASSKFKFTDRHILYGKLRPYLAKIACPDFSGVCSTDILPVLPSEKIERRYLFHFLCQPSMVSYASSRAVGVNLPRLSPSMLERFEIPLPPLSEQRRIADVLDRAQALRIKRRAALAQLDTLTQSVFVDLFGSPAHNTKNLATISLGKLGNWSSGGTPPRSREDYFVGSIPWFSSGELNNLFAFTSAEHISPLALRETTAKTVPKGALMLGMYDTAALKASIAGVECSCNQAIAFATIDSGIAESVYVYFAIVIGREHFRRLQRGIRQKNLNLSMVRDICIPKPPLNLQREFARQVASVEKLKAVQRASLAEMDALFAAVQHRAFSGEL